MPCGIPLELPTRSLKRASMETLTLDQCLCAFPRTCNRAHFCSHGKRALRNLQLQVGENCGYIVLSELETKHLQILMYE